MEQYHGTTILSVRRGNEVALGGEHVGAAAAVRGEDRGEHLLHRPRVCVRRERNDTRGPGKA